MLENNFNSKYIGREYSRDTVETHARICKREHRRKFEINEVRVFTCNNTWKYPMGKHVRYNTRKLVN